MFSTISFRAVPAMETLHLDWKSLRWDTVVGSVLVGMYMRGGWEIFEMTRDMSCQGSQ